MKLVAIPNEKISENGGGGLKIKEATKKGYKVAHEGDGIDITGRMQYHRGTVQKGLSQTLTCEGGNDVGVVVRNGDKIK